MKSDEIKLLFRVDEAFHRRFKVALAERGMTAQAALRSIAEQWISRKTVDESPVTRDTIPVNRSKNGNGWTAEELAIINDFIEMKRTEAPTFPLILLVMEQWRKQIGSERGSRNKGSRGA